MSAKSAGVFDFGKNWRDFSARRLDSRKLAEARESLQSLLQRASLKDARFLDVGCGSGLFSLAAYQLGAASVTGLDVDPQCVAVSEENRRRFTPDAPIRFLQVSALDRASLDELGTFDIVYAWGSLHHTGAMWTAIGNVMTLVSPGGTLVLSIYNKHITSPIWREVKRLYNLLPEWGQRLIAPVFAGIIYIAKLLVTRRNPLVKRRGMDFWHDVIDWIGGFPYEYARPREVETFAQERGFGLRRFVRTRGLTGCNEFVFVRTAALCPPS